MSGVFDDFELFGAWVKFVKFFSMFRWYHFVAVAVNHKERGVNRCHPFEILELVARKNGEGENCPVN